MKKILKKAMVFVSAIVVSGVVSLFPTEISAYQNKIFYENDITDIEISDGVYPDEYITFNSGRRIHAYTTRAYRMNYVIASSVKNVTNEYLGITGDAAIRKIDMGETTLYSVAVETRGELTELFNSASVLHNNGKITDAYSLMNIGYSPMEYAKDEELWMILEIACGGKMGRYLNNEPKLIVEGDANGDNELNVRDCADLAASIASDDLDDISGIADFNIDNKINIRDVAAIANHLIWGY